MTLNFIWLIAFAFLLGAVPFSLWVGYLFLRRDIRRYGDGNPGAINVFRAGSPAAGMLAVCLDLSKGMPVLFLADRVYHLSENQLLFIAFAAIMGHAFSPLLHLHGGKAVAITFGVMIGLARPEMLFPFAITALAGFLLLDNHSWVVLTAPAATLVFIFMGDASPGSLLFMTGILLLYVYKHARDLNGWPRPKKSWLYRWIQSAVRPKP